VVGVKSATEVIPGACGLAGFAVALLAGMSSDRGSASVLLGAIVAMVLCRLVGVFVASVCARLSEEAVRRHKESNPVPDVRAAIRAAGESSETGGA
jgi:hypothetical protein